MIEPKISEPIRFFSLSLEAIRFQLTEIEIEKSERVPLRANVHLITDSHCHLIEILFEVVCRCRCRRTLVNRWFASSYGRLKIVVCFALYIVDLGEMQQHYSILRLITFHVWKYCCRCKPET